MQTHGHRLRRRPDCRGIGRHAGTAHATRGESAGKGRAREGALRHARRRHGGRPLDARERRHPAEVLSLRRHRPVAWRSPTATAGTRMSSLGFDDLDSYVGDSPLLRRPHRPLRQPHRARPFTLDGKKYQLPVNDGPNSLHGGDKGFDKRVWDVDAVPQGRGRGLTLHRISPDGEMGYPGTLTVRVTYTLTGRRRLPHRLRGHDRQGHGRQPHQPHLLQPGRARAPAPSTTTSWSSPPPATPRSTRRSSPPASSPRSPGTPFDFRRAEGDRRDIRDGAPADPVRPGHRPQLRAGQGHHAPPRARR